jgi:hypothetical protein
MATKNTKDTKLDFWPLGVLYGICSDYVKRQIEKFTGDDHAYKMRCMREIGPSLKKEYLRMGNISAGPVEAKRAGLIEGASREGLMLVGLDGREEAKVVVAAIDAFAYGWQKGKREVPEGFDPAATHLALGSLWGTQMVRQFGWEWATVTFHDRGNSTAPGVVSPDRGLVIYPIHFLLGALRDPGVDVTILLAYNMLVAEKFQGVAPGAFVNVMDGVRRIVPRG